MRRNAIATIALLALLALAAPLHSQVAISDLPALSETPAASDVIPLVDTSAGTTKKVTYANLMGGTAALATALATNPSPCGSNLFVVDIAADGTLDCDGLTDADVPDTITLTNITQITNRLYSNLQSIPSTFAPSAHVLDSATHTVSGLTTGHVLQALSATTFGFAAPAAGGSSINVEEGNVEVIAAASLTGIDFLDADFDVTDDGNEANIAIAAAIARDSEVTSAVQAAVSGTTGRLPTFSGTNAVGNTNILAGADTLTLPVTTGLLIFGDGDTYLYENSDDSLRFRTGGTDRFYIVNSQMASLTAGGWSMQHSGSVGAPAYSFNGDLDNGLYYLGTNNWAASAGGSKIIDYQAAQVGFLTTTGLFSAASPTTDAAGEMGFDNNAWATGRGAAQLFDGTANTYLIGALVSDTPTNGQVPKWNTGGTITWEDDTTGGGGGALDDLTDVDTTGAATDDALCYDGAEWVPCEVLVLGNTVELTNTTIDGGAPRTGVTTLPAGSNEMPMCRHEDDVTSLTGVLDGTACFEEDSNIVYVCESPEGIAGVCDAAGEWTAQSAAASEVNDLEGDGASGIATTEIPIGTGAGTVGYAPLSGDVTMTNAGVVSIASAAVSATELDEAGVEAGLEAVLDLQDLQGAVTDAQVPNTVTIDLAATATALAANGSNCSGTQYAQGVSASGVSEGCTLITGSKSFLLPDPATADTGKLQFEIPSAVTLTEISCNVDAATSVTINLVERARATPDSGTTEMVTSDLVCDTDGATTTTFTDAALAADVPLALMIDAVSGSPTWLRVHIQYTVN